MTDTDTGIDASERIAIIGTAGRFPAARNVTALWRLLMQKRMGTRWLSAEELRAAGVSETAIMDPNYVRAGNFLSDMECFDAPFFGFSPREASILDPQHRHFLECAWEALEDAGHMPENFDGRIGVFAGSGMQAYLPFNLLSNPDLVEEIGLFLLRHTGNDKDFLTTRLSYLLNLQGPSVAIQTACSTSLVAVHQAAASLLSMECDMAIAGGVTIELPHGHGYKFAEGEIQSPDGLCRPFDNDSQGTVFGSGAAIVVLRRLEDALADGDDIRAVLIGSAVNNDGAAKAGYLAPSVDGQAEAAAEALAIAGVAPETVTYIEAHGTGTPVGDPIELAALTQVYGPGGTGFCGIGSVKSNIGHLDTAAGAAGLIKVIEALRHETLPATLHYKTPNARFDIANSPFYVVDETKPWPRGSEPRRAAVNSLGVGGTNAHAIIEEAPRRAARTTAQGEWHLFPFSARTKEALDGLAAKWQRFATKSDLPAADDIVWTLCHGRRSFDERRAVVARNGAELSQHFASGSYVVNGSAGSEKPSVVFMFPGGGAQYPGAGAELLKTAPAFADAVDACFAALPADAPADLREMMFARHFDDAEARAKLNQSGYAIPALFILEYAYARLWMARGVKPAAILGHSAGEYAGAAIAGVMSLADALKIVTWRGKVMDAAAAGAMSMIPAPRTKVEELIGDGLDIAALNAPELCVVSGEAARIDALETELKGTEYEATRIHINVAAHSRILDDQLGNFRTGIEGVTLKAPEIPFVSGLRGDWAAPEDFTTLDYWVRHLRHTVLFADAVETILEEPNRILLEVGPGRTLGPLAEMSAGEHRPRAILASGHPPKEEHASDTASMLRAAGGIWCHGGDLDWEQLPGAGGRRVSLPTYAFSRERHWIEPGKSTVAAKETDTEETPLNLPRIANPDNWFQTPGWTPAPIPPAEARPGGSWILFAGDDPVSKALSEALAARHEKLVAVRAGTEFAETDSGFLINPVEAGDYEKLLNALPALPDHILHCWPLSTEPGDQSLVFESTFLLCRAIQTSDPSSLIRLSVLGSGAASVKGEPVTRPDLGTLLGPIRVAPREVPGLIAHYIDLETGADPAVSAAMILEEHDGGATEDRIAYRSGARFKRSCTASAVSGTCEGLPTRIKENGVYLITGGTKGIGLALARYLGRTAKARLALLSRTALPPRSKWNRHLSAGATDPHFEALTIITEIEAAGGMILPLAVDVTNQRALKSVLQKIEKEFGPINGLFHGAGLMDDAPMVMKSLDDTRRVMAAKVEGGRNLDALLPEESLDFFAVFSSTSVLTAPPGQSDYVAANSYLESLAAARSDGLAISYGVWRDIGMAARAYGTGSEPGGTGGLHPLLGAMTRGADGLITFRKRYDPANLWVLSEHVVGGIPVLPGTAYVEIARAAVTAVSGGRNWELRALSLINPMIFPEGLSGEVTITLSPDDTGYEFRVESRLSPEAAPVEHARAHIQFRLFNDRRLPKTLQQTAMLAPSDSSGHDAQEDLIDFGPRWNNIGEIRIGPGEIEAEFALADQFSDDLKIYAAHPGLMDTAATVGINLLADAGQEGAFYAPMSVDRLRLLRPFPQTFRARAKLVAETPGRFASFDVSFSDANGQPLAVFEGFALRRVEGASFDWRHSPALLVDVMIAQGIRAEEAEAVFSRMLNSPARALIISPTSLPDLVREMTRQAEPGPKAAKSSVSPSKAGKRRYANTVEERIAVFWTDLLGVPDPDPSADFFDLGGHSLAAVRLFAKIRKEYQTDLPLATLFQAPTLRALADLVIEKASINVGSARSETKPDKTMQEAERWSPLVVIREGDMDIKPFYLVHGAGGNVLNFRSLSGYLDPRLPFYALRALGSDGGREVHETIEEMASCYVEAIRTRQPDGPYHIGGYSGGGVIAFEMAHQLRRMGAEVGNLVMFDSLAPEREPRKISFLEKVWTARHWSLGHALRWPLRRLKRHQQIRQVAEITAMLARGETIPDELNGLRMTRAYLKAEHRYKPKSYAGDMLIFRGQEASIDFLRAGPELGWEEWVSGEIEVKIFNCDHFNMMIDPTIGEIGAILNALLLGEE